MKTIRKNFLLLAFAAGALFLIGNNVFGSDPNMPEPPPGDQGGGTGVSKRYICFNAYEGGVGIIRLCTNCCGPKLWFVHGTGNSSFCYC